MLTAKGPPQQTQLSGHAPTVLFLPGLLNDARLWVQQLDGLGSIAHVHVADLTTAASMEKLAATAVAQAPEGPFVLVGLSMGGYVALEIMRRYSARVRGLVLIDTSARPDTPEMTAGRRELMQQAESDFPAVVKTLSARLLHPSKQHDAFATEVFHAMATDLGKQVFIRQQQAMIDRIDSRPYLNQITCPTLIICGRQDTVAPLGVHTEMAGAIPQAQLHVIEDCGHLSALEHPLQVTQALRSWLSESVLFGQAQNAPA